MREYALISDSLSTYLPSVSSLLLFCAFMDSLSLLFFNLPYLLFLFCQLLRSLGQFNLVFCYILPDASLSILKICFPRRWPWWSHNLSAHHPWKQFGLTKKKYIIICYCWMAFGNSYRILYIASFGTVWKKFNITWILPFISWPLSVRGVASFICVQCFLLICVVIHLGLFFLGHRLLWGLLRIS